MSTSPPTIAFFDAKPYDRQFFDAGNAKFGFAINYFESRLTVDTVALAAGFDAVCVFVNDQVCATVIDRLCAGGTKVLALRCAGYNQVNLFAAYGRLPVVRVPAYSPHAVAEHSVALLMTLNRRIHRAFYRVRDNNFSINGLLGFDVFGKTVGVIGTGRIGCLFATIMKGFGTRLLAYDRYPNQALIEQTGIEYVDLDTLYRESDILSLHCPLTPETHHLINSQALAQMKPGAVLINTSRGALIDTAALVVALKEGHLGGAALDVYEEESGYFFEDKSDTIVIDDVLARLNTFPNVIITSHQGFFTREAMRNITETTLQNIDDVLKGRETSNGICSGCDGSKPCPGKPHGITCGKN